jgi:hypothetical protein
MVGTASGASRARYVNGVTLAVDGGLLRGLL